MLSINALLVTLSLACSTLATPTTNKKCVTVVETTVYLYDILSYVQGVSCAGPSFDFVRYQTGPGCEFNWTTCFLDTTNSTAHISGHDGYVGYVPHSKNLTSSKSTAPAVFTFAKASPDALPGNWVVTLDGNELSVASLDSSVLRSIPAPDALDAIYFQALDTYLLDHE